jgi:hypothetical protein
VVGPLGSSRTFANARTTLTPTGRLVQSDWSRDSTWGVHGGRSFDAHEKRLVSIRRRCHIRVTADNMELGEGAVCDVLAGP